MTDALRVTKFNRLSDMKGESVRRHQAGSQFPGVKRQMHLRIILVEKIEDAHVQLVVMHGDVAVLRHYWIHRHNSRISHRHLEAGKSLRKDLLLGKSSVHLVDVAHLEPAA